MHKCQKDIEGEGMKKNARINKHATRGIFQSTIIINNEGT